MLTELALFMIYKTKSINKQFTHLGCELLSKLIPLIF